MNYQGHLADGSSVQKHSAGGLYPFVLYVQETEDRGLAWGFISPTGFDSTAKFTYDQVVTAAEAEKAAYDYRRAAKRAYNRPGFPALAKRPLANIQAIIQAGATREDPFVLYAQETACGLRWGFISPSGLDSWPEFTYDQVVAAAEAEKEVYDYRRAAQRAYNRPGLPRIAVERMAATIQAGAAREARVLHYIGDPVETGLFERSPEQQLDDRWSNMRDADFNIGPGRT